MRVKLLSLMVALLVLLAACDAENSTCPNGKVFMWETGIHCIAGQEFTTPPAP